MEKETKNKKIGSAVVVGGGIGGMQAALDLAESGIKVHLIDSGSAIGGRMVQLDKTFPTNECAMCVVSPKLVDCGRHRNIEIITLSEIEKIEGQAGNFNLTLRKKPRYIDEEKCTGCGLCVLHCPVRNQIQLPDDKRKEGIALDPQVKDEVDKIIAECKEKKGSLMLILQALNAKYNYFAENTLRYLSCELPFSLGHIVRIATFYNAFSLKPRGRHTISVCMGTTCYVKGSERIIDTLESLLNIGIDDTTKDGKFTLKSVRCLGCCSIAPAIMVNDKVYGNLLLSQIEKVLKDYK